MHPHLFIEGKSWPGGLESGRFEHMRLGPGGSLDVRVLEKALAFDMGERAATEDWGDEFPRDTWPGATCHLVWIEGEGSLTTGEIGTLARSVALGELPSEQFDFNGASDLPTVCRNIARSTSLRTVGAPQTSLQQPAR